MITSSRQHFIRFNLPQTFRHLLDGGIREDFSMGYGSINGFRASVASPFYWYDLEKGSKQLLYCFIRSVIWRPILSLSKNFTRMQALDEMTHYYNEVKKVNGSLITSGTILFWEQMNL